MTHRALQAVDAIATALAARAELGASVFKHRTLSLSDADQELPAVCVRMGEDAATNRTLESFESQLDVFVALYATATTEEALAEALMELRAQSHIAVMANQTLGLSFVSQVIYGGAGEPDVSTEGGRIAGLLETTWIVDYEMNVTDPS